MSGLPQVEGKGFGARLIAYLNLYDTVAWWADANHFVNWFLLCSGIGVLLLRTSVHPPWALGVLVARRARRGA